MTWPRSRSVGNEKNVAGQALTGLDCESARSRIAAADPCVRRSPLRRRELRDTRIRDDQTAFRVSSQLGFDVRSASLDDGTPARRCLDSEGWFWRDHGYESLSSKWWHQLPAGGAV